MRILKATSPRTRRSGFSLIEVLIAVLVLATGLLALAALQTRAVRETADARARSQMASFGQALIEEARAAGYDALTVGTDVSLATTAELSALAGRAGVSSLQETTDVAHYVGAGTDFTRFTTLQTVSSNDPQYKQIELGFQWTDASGATRTMNMVTAVSPLSLSSSGLLVTQPPAGFISARPVVRRVTPEGAGIIPIALADGSETAATNPRPKLGGTKDSLVSDTRFEVLTYREESSTVAQIQERIETAVVGCKCRQDTTGFDADLDALQTAVGYRPTFWSGTRYDNPEVATDAVTTGPEPNGNGAGAFVQSDLCDVCCRDHKDPAGVTGPKFDPWRDTHAHCASIDVSSGTPVCVAPGEGDPYLEACRLIRVDGVFRVASDLNMEHMSLIPTDSLAASPGISSATDEYETFALAYMRSRFAEGQDGTNTEVAPATSELMVTAANLNLPALIELDARRVDLRYLHSRGLYIDYLEEDAREAIGDAWEDCNLTGTEKIRCVLPYVPFSAVNLTEIGSWEPTTTGTEGDVLWLNVSNALGTIFGDPEDPVRGTAQISSAAPLPDPVPGDFNRNRGRVVAGHSNSTLARFGAIDLLDFTEATADQQTFAVRSGNSTPAAGVGFDLSFIGHPTIANGTLDDNPLASLGDTNLDQDCDATKLSNQIPDDNPYMCDSDTSTDIQVTVTKFNVVTEGAKVANPCTDNGKPEVNQGICNNYPVASVTHQGVALAFTTGGLTGESGSLQFTLSTATAGDDVVITFGTPETAVNATQYVCNANRPEWVCP